MSLESVEDIYPLSSTQQGMLFHHLYARHSGVDIEQMVCRLPEKLNVPAFQRAWESVVARHPALRASFHWEGLDEPVQKVHHDPPLPFEVQDWQACSAAAQESQLEAYLQADRRRGFDLTEAPLMRFMLFRLAEADYQLVWTFHHILADGRSHLLILKEVFAFYDAFCQGQALQLDLPRPYRDHIACLQQQDLSKAELFWRQLLRGFTTPTPLAVAQNLESIAQPQESAHGEQELRLSEPVTSALQALAQQNDLTLNTLVQGAWAILLSRYSGEEDVLFGAVRAGRRSTVPGAESTVGMFINTLPVRVRVAPEFPLLPWLKALRGQNITLRDYEHTPLVKVQGWSDRPAARSLFESILVFDNYLLNTALQAQGGAWAKREFKLLEQTNFPLTLYGYGGPALLLKLAYDRRHFDEAAITRMLGHLKTLLEAMPANPQQTLAGLPLLTEAEAHQILFEWNNTQVAYPRQLCVHHLIEAQVERTPEAVALVFEDQQLTYRQLNRRANQLAHYLRRRKVGPETRVGLYMERSLDMLVGLLAIHKAGGAYLPLDPTYPQERLAFMIEDAQVSVLLTQARLAKALPPHQAQVVCIDAEWGAISAESEENGASEVTPDNLCYLIYTSGSTGKPKGVMVLHRNVVNFFTGMAQVIPHEPPGVWLAVTSLSFDISVLELFWTLAHGFKVVLYTDRSRDPEALNPETHKQYSIPAQIKRHGVTHFQCTPAMASILLIDEAARSAFSSVQAFMVGGEALPVALAAQLGQVTPGKVINMYGPTETTVWSSTYLVNGEQHTIPIGRPIANTGLYILNQNLQPVPVGVTGELFIGGEGVVRGYLNRPELTAERFIKHPFSAEPEARLYRTGDLARYRPDGNIEFFGRIDHQVKIRGYRIELGEIETLLEQHPALRQAVVIARDDTPGDKRLAAYIIPREEQKPTPAELRDYVKQKLPEFMVPAYFVLMSDFPKTPNQKIDRKALPPPSEVKREPETPYVPPKNELEQIVVNIWQDLLKVPRVGLNDNFFDLGGHSLLIVQVHQRLRQALDRELYITDMFRFPTIQALTDYLRRDSAGGAQAALNKIADRAQTRREAMLRQRQRQGTR